MKQRTISTVEQLDALEETLIRSTAITAKRLAESLRSADSLGNLSRLKFAETGCDPLEADRPLNFVEQLNQTFTYLASIEAVRWLFRHAPDCAPFVVNLGTAPGSDITSLDGSIAAEVFAATRPDSNDKLRKDIEKVRASAARQRFVFYLSPVATRASSTIAVGDVRVVRLDHSCMLGIGALNS